MEPKLGKQKKHRQSVSSIADTIDKHRLYEESVQNAEFETEFVADIYKKTRHREARSLREDFCGTANAACEWVKRDSANTAIGVDLDADVLAWGRRNHVERLQARQAARVSLLNQNVLHADTEPVDIVLAMNFSYWCFRTRQSLGEYFRKVHASLNDRGIFFLDAYGGYEAYEEMEEETEYDDFTYVWDQAQYDPVTGHMKAHIHFRFPDGSELSPAFTYDWRLWSLPELRELLEEAGFKKITVYDQVWDYELEEAVDEFVPVQKMDADPAWVVYIAAEK
ncbi:MAG TPA: class I SAM-dependent methyltransferase [Gammaproteobacteria bacterium]|nr:class I SAM-dependent methyltransferase [Gammaproteobacteria bacterium]